MPPENDSNHALKTELNQRLRAIATIAQQHDPTSQAHRAALRQIVDDIYRSKRLCRPQKGSFSGAYEDIYAVAIQELFYYICKNIHKYNPDRGEVMTWVNMLLTRRFFKEAIPKVLGKPNSQQMTLADLDNLAVPTEPASLIECIKEAVENDPEGLFQSVHIRQHPEATFQALFLRRLSDQRWQDIATEFGLSISTVQMFFSRRLQEFSPKLREYCIGSYG